MHRFIVVAATAFALGASMLSTSASAFPGLPGPPGGGLPPPPGGGFPGRLPHFPGDGPLGAGPLAGGRLGPGPLAGGGHSLAAGRFAPRFAGAARGVGNGSRNSLRGSVYNERYAGYGRGRYGARGYAAAAAAAAYAGAAYGSGSGYGTYGSNDEGCYYAKRTYQTSTGWRTRRVYVCN